LENSWNCHCKHLHKGTQHEKKTILVLSRKHKVLNTSMQQNVIIFEYSFIHSWTNECLICIVVFAYLVSGKFNYSSASRSIIRPKDELSLNYVIVTLTLDQLTRKSIGPTMTPIMVITIHDTKKGFPRWLAKTLLTLDGRTYGQTDRR